MKQENVDDHSQTGEETEQHNNSCPNDQTEQEEHSPFVSPYFEGGSRTGNRLFEVAAVYAHALRHGLNCRIPWRIDAHTSQLYDSLGEAALVCPNGGYEGPVSYSEKNYSYDPIPAEIVHGRILGYFQSEKYFIDHTEEIRTLYAKLILPRQQGIAGIHVRMGDYLADHNKLLYHTLNAEFLEEALGHLSDNINTLQIFSDSPELAVELIHSVPSACKFEIVLNKEDTLHALRTLSSMQELIISCSSFSWWAAWLGNQEKVMVQKQWMVHKDFNCKDIHREHWIRI